MRVTQMTHTILNKPTIPSGNQIIDWTGGTAGTDHSSNDHTKSKYNWIGRESLTTSVLRQ